MLSWAGTKTRYHWGEEPDIEGQDSWSWHNSEGRTHAVGTKPANPRGLHDMLGNVFEMCWASANINKNQASHETWNPKGSTKEHGIGAAAPGKVKHNVEEGQDVLRAAILSGSDLRRYHVHPRCKETIKALGGYRARELSDGSFDPRPDPDPANHAFSHGCDALRYLMWRLRRTLGLGGRSDDAE